MVASFGASEHEFLCFDCVLGDIVDRGSLSALSVLSQSPPIAVLRDYVLHRYLSAPTQLLVPFIAGAGLGERQLRAVSIAAVDAGIDARTAHCHVMLLLAAPAPALEDALICSDVVPHLLLLLQRTHAEEGKQDCLRLLCRMLRAQSHSLDAMHIVDALRHMAAFMHQHSAPRTALDCCMSLLTPPLQSRVVDAGPSLSALASALAKACLAAAAPDDAIAALETLLQALETDPRAVCALSEHAELVPRVFALYVDMGEAAAGRRCFRAVCRLAGLCPLHAFHYSVFTPFLLRHVVLFEVTHSDDSADAAALMEMVLHHSAAHDKELNDMCATALASAVAADQATLFWASLARLLAGRSVFSFDDAIRNAMAVAACDPPLSPSQHTLLGYAAACLTHLRQTSEATVARARPFLRLVASQGLLAQPEVLASVCASLSSALLPLLADLSWCPSFHRELAAQALATRTGGEARGAYASVLFSLLDHSTHAHVLELLNTVAASQTAEGLAPALLRHVRSSPASNESDAPLLLLTLAAPDALALVAEPLLSKGYAAPAKVARAALQMAEDPLSVLGCDPLVALLRRALDGAACADSHQHALFLLLTLHFDQPGDRAWRALAAYLVPGSRAAALSHWCACPRVASALVESLLHRLGAQGEERRTAVYCVALRWAAHCKRQTDGYQACAEDVTRLASLACACSDSIAADMCLVLRDLLTAGTVEDSSGALLIAAQSAEVCTVYRIPCTR